MIRFFLITLSLIVAAQVALIPQPSFAKSKFNKVLDIGDAAPDWKDLPGVDGKKHSLADYDEADLVVIVFAGNLCPMTKSYEERLTAFAKTYAERKVQVIAINVNPGEVDSLEKMKTRAAESKYSFPYLRDDSQKSARAYGATVTPHFFLLDRQRKIAYMGAFDNELDPAKADKPYLVDAVEALLAGKPPRTKESLQRGCPIGYAEEPGG